MELTHLRSLTLLRQEPSWREGETKRGDNLMAQNIQSRLYWHVQTMYQVIRNVTQNITIIFFPIKATEKSNDTSRSFQRSILFPATSQRESVGQV